MVNRMKLLALGLKHQHLDNECLAAFKACIAKNGITHELVPLDCHCHNIAKRDIQMFKNHFVSILSGVNDRFPLSLWCHIVKPAELTVNLFQQSKIAPKVSVYAHPWATQLHEKPICTPGMHGNGPCQTQEQMILGCSRGHQFQHWDSFGSSLMCPHLHCKNQGNKNKWHSVLQTPVYNKPTGHTQNTHHKGGIGPHKCIKRNNLMQWQDSRGAPKVQRAIHKDSHGKIRTGKGKSAMEQPLKSPQCPPSCTTCKGGWETTYPSKPTSKGANRNCGGWLSSHLNAYTNFWRRDAMTGDMRSTHHEAKLRFAGQRQQQTKPQVPHKVTNNKYYAKGNACMHWHHQVKIQDFSTQTGYQKKSHW